MMERYAMQNIKRGDIFWADLGNTGGCEQGGVRPVVILQNNIGNRYSPTVIVAAITSQADKAKLPTHVEISSQEYGLSKDSLILLEQIRTLDKKRLGDYVSTLSIEDMEKVDRALGVSIEINTKDPIALEKVYEIKGIKKFIQIWLEKSNDLKAIEEDLLSLKLLTRELEEYCLMKKINLNYYINLEEIYGSGYNYHKTQAV